MQDKKSMKIHFQMIADNRFVKDIEEEIRRLNDLVVNTLTENNISFSSYDYYGLIDFKDGTKQYRTDYYIPKTKEFTYKKVYSLINKIKAPVYKIIKG